MSNDWQDGDFIIGGRCIEVRQIMHARRGRPLLPGGWDARLCLGENVFIRLDCTVPTRQAAQDAIRSAIRGFLKEVA